MSQYEQRDNSGSLFRNEKKEQPNHADYTGNGMIGGEEYWINAWVKEAKNGKKYFSFSFRPKQQRSQQSGGNQQSTPEASDEIPF